MLLFVNFIRKTNDISPSWKSSSWEKSCRFCGKIIPPSIMSLTDKLQINIFVTFLIFLVFHTTSITKKLLTTAKNNRAPTKKIKTASSTLTGIVIAGGNRSLLIKIYVHFVSIYTQILTFRSITFALCHLIGLVSKKQIQ